MNATTIQSFRNDTDKEGNLKSGYLLIKFKNKMLGQGTFSHVYSSRVYRQEIGDIWEKKSTPEKRFVTKVIDLDTLRNLYPKGTDIRAIIQNEFLLSRKAGHLGIKPPFFTDHICYVTMKRMPGDDLDKIITRLLTEPDYLSEQQRIDLTRALLLAYKTQVADKGIVHRDLKPDNIRVSFSDPIVVNILDFGLAKMEGEDDHQSPGSPYWAAPEVFANSDHDKPADIFSMGRILSGLWGTPSHTIIADSHQKAYLNSINAARQLALPQENQWMTPLLKSMLARAPKKRMTIDEVIAQFEVLVSSLLQPSPQVDPSSEASIKFKKLIDDLTDNAPSFHNYSLFKATIGRFTRTMTMKQELKAIANEEDPAQLEGMLINFIDSHLKKGTDKAKMKIINKVKQFLDEVYYHKDHEMDCSGFQFKS